MKYLFAVLMALTSMGAFAGKCEQPSHEGCWSIMVLNVKFNTTYSMMKSVQNGPASPEVRQERIQYLGPKMFEAYQMKLVEAAKPRTFLVYVWKGGKPDTSYRVNGRKTEGGRITQGRFDIVTGKVPTPKFEKKDLGKPAVYRVHAEGKDAIGISLQFPWNVMNEKTTILVRSEDDLTVYPKDDKDANNGLWVMGEQLAVLKKNGIKGSFAPMISKE